MKPKFFKKQTNNKINQEAANRTIENEAELDKIKRSLRCWDKKKERSNGQRGSLHPLSFSFFFSSSFFRSSSGLHSRCNPLLSEATSSEQRPDE